MKNAEPFIVITLASLLADGELPIELIVVDDKSTDRSAALVEEVADSRVFLLEGEGKGIARCFNRGLDAARGDLVVRCDADDLFPPGRIVRQFKWLQRHSDYGACCGNFLTLDPRGRELTVMVPGCGKGEEITEELHSGITRTHFCTYAVRTRILRDVGGMREFFQTGEDIDLQFRLSEHCRIWYDPEVCYQYRIHKESITHRQSNTERMYFEQCARDFQIQRQRMGQDQLQRGTVPTPPEGHSEPHSAVAHIQSLLIGKAWQKHREGEKWRAVADGFRSLMLDPTNWRYWRSFFALFIKR